MLNCIVYNKTILIRIIKINAIFPIISMHGSISIMMVTLMKVREQVHSSSWYEDSNLATEYDIKVTIPQIDGQK